VPKPLAEIVIEEGLASAAEVERAADWADRERVPLVVALIRELGLDELALVSAIRRHVRVAVGDPAREPPELDAVRELPREVARRLRVVPLALGSAGGRRSLDIAVADPTDAVALAEVEHVTGCDVEPRVMTLAAIEELVESSYRHLVTEVMHREKRGRRGGRKDAAARGARRMTAEGRATSEAGDLALRHQALLAILIEKQLITRDEYEAELRRLTSR
jgi:hypothetical protein